MTSQGWRDRRAASLLLAVALAAFSGALGAPPIAAHSPGLDMSTQLEARAPMLKAGQPVIWSGSETSTVR